jgi:hypothetical protein
MAYPTVSASYGLQPINLIGGQVFAGSTRQMRIASGVTDAIYYGDLVTRQADGTIVRANSTTTAPVTGFIGVFLGCSYINTATNQPVQAQYCPAGLTVTSGFITAFVADDPDQLFKAVVVASSGTAPSTTSGAQYSSIGLNAAIVNNAGSTVTGNSLDALSVASFAVTKSLPLRIVDVVPDTAFVSSGTTYYPEVIVKINAPFVDTGEIVKGGHNYNNPTGL